MPRRTFYNYRQAAEELFNIEILNSPSTFEYYIAETADSPNGNVTNWLLNSSATNELLANSREVADRIFFEEVPSAREFLAPVIEALRTNHPICFDYHSYDRIRPSKGIIVEPYFLKIFRQRWYVTGRHVESDRIKTYALDRIVSLTIGTEAFKPDPTFDAKEFSENTFGVIYTHGKVYQIAIRADLRQAKYFRALPLHHTQHETVHSDFSIFHYQMQLSPDLVGELLSYGASVQVLSPPELRRMVQEQLTQALKQYSKE